MISLEAIILPVEVANFITWLRVTNRPLIFDGIRHPMSAPKRYISLDISTNTGYAIFHDSNLIKYGCFTKKVSEYKADVKTYQDFPNSYPNNFIEVADAITVMCLKLIRLNDIQMVIIEHSEKGKQRLSQRLLEWMHLTLIRELNRNQIPYKYILVNDWRKVVKCYVKYWPDYQVWNKEVRKAKAKAIPTKKGRKIAKIEGKRVSHINQKKLSIIIANKEYDLDLKNDNIADAINIGRAAKELNMI